MPNRIALPIIHLIQRLSMVLTLGCCIYLVFFLLFMGREGFGTAETNHAPLKNVNLASPAPVVGLKPNNISVSFHVRNIFSLSDAGPSDFVENTPNGQLPAHLKIVAMVIADPSQIVIEDTFTKKTYFIDEAHPQDGIKMVRTDKKQMVINYQGQDIIVPITKY
jgi:hypothetical protein